MRDLVSVSGRLEKEISIQKRLHGKKSEGSNHVMKDSKGLLQLAWAFSCLPSTAVLGLLVCNSEERLEGINDISQFNVFFPLRNYTRSAPSSSHAGLISITWRRYDLDVMTSS